MIGAAGRVTGGWARVFRGPRMRFDEKTTSLQFASAKEAQEFHLGISALVRGAMVEATRSVDDPERAKALSREVIKEYRAVMRALNAFRTVLPRKDFG